LATLPEIHDYLACTRCSKLHFGDCFAAVLIISATTTLNTNSTCARRWCVMQVIPSAKKANWPAMLPSRGALACSFSSASLRRPLGVMEPAKLATLQRQLRASSMSDRERLELVAMFAPFALFSCKQVRRLRCHVYLQRKQALGRSDSQQNLLAVPYCHTAAGNADPVCALLTLGLCLLVSPHAAAAADCRRGVNLLHRP
jgi:hypothetical protein